MSASSEYTERLNLAELVSRIERQQEETRKFVAEQHKLTAEAQKLNRDRFWVPVLAVAAALAAFVSLLKSSGVL
jgi:anti-sigma-K factor RskA